MSRADIIKELKEKGIAFNPTAKVADLEALLTGETPSIVEDNQEVETPKKEQTDMEKLMGMMSTVVNKVSTLEDRLKKVEGPDSNAFKTGATISDIETASSTKAHLDEKLVKIVEEVLGVDFGIELDTFPDRPGFLFTVIVPERLSDISLSTRPVIDPETGKYKVQEDGKTPVLEDYKPQDRRSRAIGSTQSYDAVREHCTRVRSYLVSYYQKMSKPLPEFKIKA